MVRVKAARPEKLLSRPTTTLKSGLKTNTSFTSLKKLQSSFVITVLDENEVAKKEKAALPAGFVVTDNTSDETDGNASSSQPMTKPKLKNARCMFVGDEYVLRKTFSYFTDDGKEVTYHEDEPFNDDEFMDEDDEFNTSRVDEVNESWNAAYGDVSEPGTPRRVSFGPSQDILVDKVRWTPKDLRQARKGPWLKLAFTRKQSCPDSWTVYD